LKPGDVVLTIAGKSVPDTKALQNIVMSLPLNKGTIVTIIRDTRTMSLTVTIEQQPDDFGVPRVPEL